MESPSFSRSVRAQARSVPSRAAIFHDMGVNRRFLDHGDIVEQAHVAHAAAGMARIQISAQQRELFAGGFRRHFGARQIGGRGAVMRFWLRLAANRSVRMRTDTQAEQPSQAGR